MASAIKTAAMACLAAPIVATDAVPGACVAPRWSNDTECWGLQQVASHAGSLGTTAANVNSLE
eukprot:gene2270-12148_t